MRIIVGVTGASGVAMGGRLVECLVDSGEHDVHVVLTRAARRLFEIEEGAAPEFGAPTYAEDDMEAPLASSSFCPDAMVVAPCSMKTLAALAHGFQTNLLARAGDIALKMRRPLVVVPRETPLSLPVVENMAALLRAGAVVLPPSLALYPRPRTVADMVDFVVGKVLDVLGIRNELYRRWAADEETP